MKAIITIAMLISALFSTKEKNTNILKYGIYADASRCIAIETVDYETGQDITLSFCDMGTQDVHDDMVVSARYDRYDLLP